jgi:four helix bundle suffix protein
MLNGSIAEDVRWKYGVLPRGNANFAWVQHFIHHLDQQLRRLEHDFLKDGGLCERMTRARRRIGGFAG